MRTAGPGWRYLGALLSWGLFALSFALLYRGASTVMGLGGFCASGGPYEIEVECPAEVAATVPLSIFGGLLAVGVGVMLARGFAAPLVGWAWPVLFVGLGIAFGYAGFTVGEGMVTNLLLAAMFVAMGAVPLVLGLRAAPRELFLGTTRADGTPFVAADTGRSRILARLPRTTDGEAEPVLPSGGDWVRGIGIPLLAIAAGLWAAGAIVTAIVG